MARKPVDERDNTPDSGFYVVGVMDLLGQSDRLKLLKLLPCADAECEEVAKKTLANLARISAFRKQFRESFESINSVEPNAQYNALTESERNALDKLANVQLYTQNFSDMVVLHSPLVNVHGVLTAKGLYAMLFASAWTMMCQLERKVAFRGGIEIGIGAQDSPEEVYGPVLLAAHTLENKVAGYPRVVVGRGALSFLQMRRIGKESRLEAKAREAFSGLCKDMICTDSDGAPIVDFLGRGMHRLAASKAGVKGVISAGLKFVEQECKRFEGDAKLGPRYDQLRRYYLSRVDLWRS